MKDASIYKVGSQWFLEVKSNEVFKVVKITTKQAVDIIDFLADYCEREGIK